MSGIKQAARIQAPAPSKKSVPVITRLVRRTIPRSSITLKLSCISPRSLKPILRRKSMDTVMPMVINPSPPIWIKTRSTICPKSVQCVKVSATIRPVTQVALAEVNSAVKNEVCSPDFVANGSIKSSVPASMIRKNPPAIICIPEKRLYNLGNIKFIFTSFSSYYRVPLLFCLYFLGKLWYHDREESYCERHGCEQ